MNGYVPLLDRKALLPDSAGNLPAAQPLMTDRIYF
jgi:hypothetical protein